MGRLAIGPVCFTLLISVFFPVSTFAQQTTGRIEGYILDESGRPIVRASVTARGPDIAGPRTTASQADGYFVLEVLPVGIYEVRVEAAGFDLLVQTDIAVRLGQTANLGFLALRAQAHELEILVVTAKALTITEGETTVGGDLLAEEFGGLPQSRSYNDLAALLPHVQKSPVSDDLNFAGGTQLENKWYVDGAETTDPIFSNQGTELPYNFVRAVQVRVGGYQAEYRGALGGVVDVITRRGSNTFGSEVFGYFLNDKTAGNALQGIQDPDKGSFARWDVGGGISGPLSRERLWYFLAYNPAFDREEVDVAGLGLLDDEKTTHRFAARLDWRASDANDISLSVTGNPSRREGPIPYTGTPSAFADESSVMAREDFGVVASTLKGFHYLGTGTLLESTLSLVWSRNDWQPATAAGAAEIYFQDYETDVISGGTWGKGLFGGFDLTAGLKGTWQLGTHTLKAGAEYRRYSLDIDMTNDRLMRYFDSGAGEESFYLLNSRSRGTLANRAPAAFVQDSWRLGSRLRLNLGLRWSGQSLLDSEGDVAVSIPDQWQPRLGASYLVGEERRSKIFGSAGRFYQDLSLYAPSVILVDDASYDVFYFDHDPRVDSSGGTLVYNGDDTVIDDLRGQHYDEFTLGYEHKVGGGGRVTVRGIYRELQEAIEDTWSDDLGVYVWGNPGRGNMSEFPRPSRDYTALELTYQLTGAERFNLLASYVLSRNRGNTTGISCTDYEGGAPNLGPQWDLLEQTVNGHGLLPNDRTHVVKLAGSWRAGQRLTLGSTMSWMQGSPLNELGAASDPYYHIFLVPRGTAGRLPDLWDFNLRLSYDLGPVMGHDPGARIMLDLLHIGSQRQVTNVDQRHYQQQDEEGNQISPNPTYLQAINYQPPFAVRLGAQVNF